MPRAYGLTHPQVSLTAAATAIIELTNHTNRSTCCTRAAVSQQSNTSSQQQGIQLADQSTAGTNVTSPGIRPLDKDDAAAGFTASGLLTVLGTIGNVLYADSFNWQNPWVYLPVPEERIWRPGAAIWALRTTTTPPALTINDELNVLEVG